MCDQAVLANQSVGCSGIYTRKVFNAMKLEREIQDWVVQLASINRRHGESDFSTVLRYDSSPLSQEMKAIVEGFGFKGTLASSRHRSVHQACRVLRSLVEPRFWSADKNISKTPGQILKPDLVLEDEISGAFVIVELKRSRKAAREFATELLAYANCLIQQHQGSQVFLVLVSTSWAPLERLAFAELALRHIPVLALEYREEGGDERTPTLWVRSDLLPVAGVEPFPAHALLVDTKVFLLPVKWSSAESWINRIEHTVTALTREAEKERASGFVIVWNLPHEVPSQSGNKTEVRVFVSMAVRNPCRPQKFPDFQNEQESIDFAWSNSVETLTDDTAVRLLLDLKFGEDVQYFSSENEGTWNDLCGRLEREDACIQRFYGFGEIGYQVDRWCSQKRYALRPVILDITLFPSWHPLTWLQALESLIVPDEQEDEDQLAWHAFRRGEELGKFRASHSIPREGRHFGQAVSQMRFARTWCDFFAARQDAPIIPAKITNSGLRLSLVQLDSAISFALSCVEEEGALASLCFALGYYAGSDSCNVDYLVKLRHGLRMEGISFPHKLDAMVDELERRQKHNLTPDIGHPPASLGRKGW